MMIIGSPIVRRLARPSASTARAVVGAKSFSAALDRERSSASSRAFVIDGGDCDFESKLRRDDASAVKPRYSLASTLVSAHAATFSGNPRFILPSAHRRLLAPVVLTYENSSAERRPRIIETRRRARQSTSRGHRAQGIALRGAREHVPLLRARGAGGGERGRARRVLAQVRDAGRVSRHRWRRESGLVGILLRHRGVDVSSHRSAAYLFLIAFSAIGTPDDAYPAISLDYTSDEAVRLLTFDEGYDGFVCGPSEMTRPGDDPHLCRVHTLEEVLATLRDHPGVPPGFVVYVELKGPGTSIPAVELVGRMDVGRMRVRYSSFDHSRIVEVREADERAVTGALFSGRVPDDFVEAAIAAGADEVHLRYDTCTYDRVREAHRAGLNTMAWFRSPLGMREDCSTSYIDVGNEDESMYRTVLRSGVGSVCVNRPDVMVKVLEGMNRLK